MLTWTERIEMYLTEGRTISGGKGDKTIKKAEEQQAGFSKTLMKAFQTQFKGQQNVLNFLTGKLTEGVNTPQGFSAAQIQGLNTQAINNTGVAYQNALKAQQAQSATHGGGGLPSGVQAQIEGQLGGAAAGMQAGQLNEIQLASEQQRQNNYWNSVQGLQQNAGLMNPLGYAGQATGAGSAVAGLGDAYMNSKKGFWSSFNQSLGSTLGHTLGGGNMSPGSGWMGG
jgi:hypothetical protein